MSMIQYTRRSEVQVLTPLNAGWTRVRLLGHGFGFARYNRRDHDDMWEIPTAIIPLSARSIGCHFILESSFCYKIEEHDTLEDIKEAEANRYRAWPLGAVELPNW